RYHKAHYHGPGAVLVGLKGNGYVNLWPRELGIHPWQDGHADQVVLVEWGPNSVYVPPDGWFHQHISTGKVTARHVAVDGGTNPPDGSPQATPTWVDVEPDETHIVINTVAGHIKANNIERDPRVAVTVVDSQNPWRNVTVRGTVVEIRGPDKGSNEHIHALAK